MSDRTPVLVTLRENLREIGIPRLLIALFLVVLFGIAIATRMDLAGLLTDSLLRAARNGILVLALLPAVQGGVGLNFGLPIGIICGYFGKTLLGIDRVVRIAYPIPTIAWIPLVLIWFGPGTSAITFMVFIAAFWPTYMQAFEGTRQLSTRYLRVARSLGASRKAIIVAILVPGGLPYLLNGLRLGYGEAWRLLVAAEMLLATTGLGQHIQVSRSMLEVDKIIAGMIVIGLLGFLVERFVFDRVELATLGSWYRREEGAEIG